MFPRWLILALFAGLLMGLLACGSKSERSTVESDEEDEPVLPPWFEDITASSGVKFTYRNGEDSASHYAILESLGGGVGLIDYDGDGLMDIFITGGGYYGGKDKKEIRGYPCALFRNKGKGKFEDVTKKVGLDKLALFYTHGVAVGDYDRDGRPDLLITGYGRIALLRNIDGKRFEDVTKQAKLDASPIHWASSAAWGDLDGDGYPDLYVCQYVDWGWKKHPTDCTYGAKRDGKEVRDVCTPKAFNGLNHLVYRNNRGRTFTDQSATAKLKAGGPEDGKGLGVLMVDVNEDGKPDVYVCNDTTDNYLYLNQSVPGKIIFKECGLISGVARDDRATPNGSMGVDAGDYDGSGRPSIWVTNYEGELHALYRNDSKKKHVSFQHVTSLSGIADLGQVFVGWGTAFVDFDLDGWEDLFVANGHAIRHPTDERVGRSQRPVLLRNLGNGKFKDISVCLGPYGRKRRLSRGVGFGDLDNDGRGDVVINSMNEPVAVLKCIAGKDRHWLGIDLRGKKYADFVGARVVVEVGGRKQTRFAKGGGSYASSADRRMVFGLGEKTKVDRVTVYWPHKPNDKQEVKDFKVDRYNRVEQQ